MKKFLSFSLLFALISMTAYSQIKLSYDLNENTSYDSKIILKQDISQTMMGQTQNIDSDQGYGVNITVMGINDDTYSMKLTYSSIMVKSPMAGLDYDSETATSEPTGSAKAVSSVIGSEVTFDMTKNGAVSNIEGMKAMLDKMVENMELTDEAQASAFKAQMSAQYNAESIESQMKRTMINFPDKELNKGDTWSEDQSIATPFAMNIQTSYELADYDNENVTINVTSDIFTEGESASMGGATMTPDLSGVQSGTIVLDRKTGLVISSNLEQLISGVLNITSPQEMEVPMEISGNTDVKGTIK